MSALYPVYVKAYQMQDHAGKCGRESFPLYIRLPGLGGQAASAECECRVVGSFLAGAVTSLASACVFHLSVAGLRLGEDTFENEPSAFLSNRCQATACWTLARVDWEALPVLVGRVQGTGVQSCCTA